MKTTDLEQNIWVKSRTKKDCITELAHHYNIDQNWTWAEWEAVMGYATNHKNYNLQRAFINYYDNVWDTGIDFENESGESWSYYIEMNNHILETSDIKTAWRHIKLDEIIKS
jgi:hypothetical protein